LQGRYFIKGQVKRGFSNQTREKGGSRKRKTSRSSWSEILRKEKAKRVKIPEKGKKKAKKIRQAAKKQGGGGEGP